MNTAHSLSLQWSPASAAVGAVFLIFAAVICALAWRRNGYSTNSGLLEFLRFCIVVLVAATLLQPEWLVEYQPEKRPEIVVCADVSKSMNTRDVLDEASSSAPPITRAESIAPLLDSQTWESLKDRFDIVFETFSSALPEPTEGSDLNAVLASVNKGHEALRAVVLLSDGDWNTGDPPARAASQLRMNNIPVFTLAVGSETRLPDLELSRVDAPTFGVLGKPLRIPFVVESSLPREAHFTVTLTPPSGEAATTEVTVPAMGEVSDALLWTPYEKGEFELTVRIPVHEQESVTENNVRKVPISIREETLKVLLVESYPRWEYRYLRNALERDPGVQVSCVLFHPGLSKVGGGKGYLPGFPKTMEGLSQFDVVFLGDVGVDSGQLTIEDCKSIKALIQSQASGLVLMPGFRGAQHSFVGTDLEELYPVTLDPAQPRGWGSPVPAQFELSESGRRSLLTQLEDTEDASARLWENLPGFQWYAAALRAKAGSEVLAYLKGHANPRGRLPLLVTKTYGTGKILYIGTDGAWRWREGVEDKYHYRFWGQVARWMAYQRGMAHGENLRLFYTPDRPHINDTVTLHANVMSGTGEPLREGKVMVQVVSPLGKTESVRLAPSGDWGLFSGTFTPSQGGPYQLKLTSDATASTLDATLAVEWVRREKLGHPARYDVLEEISALTGGKMVRMGELRGLLAQLSELPDPEPIVRRLKIWCHPAWAGMLVFLLALFWTARKLVGVI